VEQCVGSMGDLLRVGVVGIERVADAAASHVFGSCELVACKRADEKRNACLQRLRHGVVAAVADDEVAGAENPDLGKVGTDELPGAGGAEASGLCHARGKDHRDVLVPEGVGDAGEDIGSRGHEAAQAHVHPWSRQSVDLGLEERFGRLGADG